MRRRIPFHSQVTLHGCGAACLLMVLGHHAGRRPAALQSQELADRRWSARELLSFARESGLAARAVRIPLDGSVPPLPRASILHLRVGHYVVLDSLSRGHAVVLDPSIGRRRLRWTVLAAQLSGVALVFGRFADMSMPSGRSTPAPVSADRGADLPTGAGKGARRPGAGRALLGDILAAFAPGLPALVTAAALQRHPASRRASAPLTAVGLAATLACAVWGGADGPLTRSAHSAARYRAADDVGRTLARADIGYFVARGNSDLLARWRTAPADRAEQRLVLPWCLAATGYVSAAVVLVGRQDRPTAAGLAAVWSAHTVLVAAAEYRAGIARRERLLAQESSHHATAELLASLEQAQPAGAEHFRRAQQGLVAQWRRRTGPLLETIAGLAATEREADEAVRGAGAVVPLLAAAVALARRHGCGPQGPLVLAVLAASPIAVPTRAVRTLVRRRVDAVRHARLADLTCTPPDRDRHAPPLRHTTAP
ncbi:cysteine peptidase family C39 domain-containing protein [Streptomyces sp. NPDC055966]|uniref:cysteine peptidase family C39 domain-containing protein n=1 Tax=Streptomyces sp. NPDC055966 TaxID=3345669 RepID=UPI0035E22FD6